VTCLVEYGYSDTTVVKIAEMAGVSRGAQLHHFPSKEDLLTSAIEHLAEKRFNEIRTFAKPPDKADLPDSAITAEAIELVWSTFTGPLFLAAMELWQASRTDAPLRACVYVVERSLGRVVHAMVEDLFPSSVTDASDFDQRFATVTYLMRGLALTRLLKVDPAEEARILEYCTRVMLADDPSAAHPELTSQDRAEP
jgi:AcrR family transcriptional regulator